MVTKIIQIQLARHFISFNPFLAKSRLNNCLEYLQWIIPKQSSREMSALTIRKLKNLAFLDEILKDTKKVIESKITNSADTQQ